MYACLFREIRIQLDRVLPRFNIFYFSPIVEEVQQLLHQQQ